MACRCVTAVMTTILLVAFPAFSQPSGSNELGMNSNISTNVTINGEDIDIADFGFIIPNGTISGCVWNDTPPNNIIEEGDGIMESGEEGLKGLTFHFMMAKLKHSSLASTPTIRATTYLKYLTVDTP